MRRLEDLTATLSDQHLRHAAIAGAILAEAIGSAAINVDHTRSVIDATRLPVAVKSLLHKAAVAAGNTTDGTWAGPLASAAATAALLRGLSRPAALTRLAELGAVRVPVVKLTAASQTVAATASWVTAGAPKPLQALTFGTGTLTPKAIESMSVVSEELAKMGTPESLGVIEAILGQGLVGVWDTTLLDATAASTARPAGLRNGVGATSAGADVGSTIGAIVAALANGAPVRPVLVCNWTSAVRISAALPGLAATGIPLVVSAGAGTVVLAIDVAGLAVSDDGGSVSATTNASVQMDDNPTDPTVAATVLISLWQRNLVGVRVERLTTWSARPGAVAWVAALP